MCNVGTVSTVQQELRHKPFMRKHLKIYPNIKRNIIFVHGIRSNNRVFETMRDRLIGDPEIGGEKDKDGRAVNWVTTINYGYLFASLCWSRFMKHLVSDYIAARLAINTYKYPEARKIVFAHSYGSYALAQALLKYREEFIVDDLVFLGSVIDTHFPWNNTIESGYVKNAFCYIGGRDWVQFFAYYFAGMGKSGKYGFSETGNGKVRNIIRKNWGHNGYEKGYDEFKKIILGKYDEIPVCEYSR